MIYFVIILGLYVAFGFGFALASWLQAAEIVSDDGGDWSTIWQPFLWFIITWPLIALYCYRAEVSKTIDKII